ncbi:hypothetical protein CRD59_03710 [Bifidobacterium xylocopae]|uniref:Leucine rich repeat variant domain-containing protein n=2 Tax=Bifidobacterium xylocopae TaxID=2493119 RepID=A0A366KCN4_9BIFI|nr:hypothetical protein CRD59_03710 [Bifidobacterium xylocopae]
MGRVEAGGSGPIHTRAEDAPDPPKPPLVLTPALACDPDTDQDILWHIAREVPELRRWLPANPRATPELLETVSQLGGPGVAHSLGLLLDYLDARQP